MIGYAPRSANGRPSSIANSSAWSARLRHSVRANNQALNGRATKHLPARALERQVNRTLRILRIADVPDNRCGGMSRVMYCTGGVLEAQGHTVDYVFSPGLVSAAPTRLRRFW